MYTKLFEKTILSASNYHIRTVSPLLPDNLWLSAQKSDNANSFFICCDALVEV